MKIGIFAPNANEFKRKNGKQFMHKKWHTDRDVVNPNCELCVQPPSGVEVSEPKK